MSPYKHFIFILILTVVLPINHVFAKQEAINVIGQLDSSGAVSYTQGFSRSNTGFNAAYDGATYLAAPQAASIVDTVNHRLFVTDSANARILIYNLDSSTNSLVDHAADYVIGQQNFQSNHFGNGRTGLSSPVGMAWDPTNKRLFVSDSNLQRVTVYDLSSGITNGMSASYVLGQSSFSGQTGGTTQSTFTTPEQMAYSDSSKYLYVADYSNSRVMVFDLSAGITNGMNATYVIGQANFTTSTGTTTQSGLKNPIGVAVDDTNHRLFVSDLTNRRVMVYDTSALATGMNASNVIGQAGFTTATASLTAAGMSQPREIAYDSTNNRLFVADLTYNRVLVFATTSISNGMSASYELGQAAGGTAFTTSAAAATAAGMSQPTGVGYDSVNDRLYVTLFAQNRITIFNLASIANGMSASDVLGQVDSGGSVSFTTTGLNTPSGVSIVANAYSFHGGPDGMTMDTVNHRLFVSDTSARVLVYNLNSSNVLVDYTADYVIGQSGFTTTTSACTQAGLGDPRQLAYDSTNDRLFVADRSKRRVMVYDTSNLSTGMNASYVLGQTGFTTCTQSATQTNFTDTWAVAYDDARQYLFVADTARVLVFDLSTSISTGMAASYVLGTTSFTSVTVGTTQSTFLGVVSRLAYDPTTKYLFASDNGSNRVLVFNTTTITNGMNASYVLGQTDFTSANAGADQNHFNFVTGLFYDTTGKRLFVSDYYNSRTLLFDLSSGITNGMNAVSVIGQDSFTDTEPATTQDGSSGPTHLFYDSGNSYLYVQQFGNERVVVIPFLSISTTSLDNGNIGRTYSGSIVNSGTSSTSSYILKSGDLPPGLTLGETLSGTPTTAGTYTFTITGKTFLSSDQTFTIIIVPVVSSSGSIPHFRPVFYVDNSSSSEHDTSMTTSVYTPKLKSGAVLFENGRYIYGYTLSKTKDFLYSDIIPFVFSDNNPILEIPRQSYPQYIRFYSPKGGTSDLMTIPSLDTNSRVAVDKKYNFGSVTLKLGSRGVTVKELQKFLNTTTTVPLSVDGVFGKGTLAVVRAWQKEHLLKADGIVGNKTKQKIEATLVLP